jgi:hypothetical protein
MIFKKYIMKHSCGEEFHELVGEELTDCPHCNKKLVESDITKKDLQFIELKILPLSGEIQIT